MDSRPSRPERPDVCGEQRRLSDVIKRVRKLRWIGMEDEAKRVLISARRTFPTDEVSAVLAEPRDTD